MKHTRHIWLAFAVSLAVVLAAMAGLSLEVLRLGRIEARLDRQEAAAEKVRLALWRMDSALMPLLTRESARRWSDYAAYRRVSPYDLDRKAARTVDRRPGRTTAGRAAIYAAAGAPCARRGGCE